jgi:hypothetical protein
MHPFAFPPCGYDSGAAQVGQVPGYFWLGLIQNLDEITDADFLLSHEIQEPEAGAVTESLKEALDVERFWFCRHGHNYICIDECVQQ